MVVLTRLASANVRRVSQALRALAREVRADTRNQRHLAVLRRAVRDKIVKK